MAILTRSPMPLKFESMTSRRVPLSNVPNAANSPARHVAASKRSRDQTLAQENLALDLLPKAKRQALDATQARSRLSPLKQFQRVKESRLFSKATPKAQPTAFERRLLAAKEVHSPHQQQRLQRQEKETQETLGEVRQWQKHYKKAFPAFVFYFEGLPEETRSKYSRTVRNLGAREEKFFSKEVTHVVTTRPIPTPANHRDLAGHSHPTATSTAPSHPQTINPSAMEHAADPQATLQSSKPKFSFDAPSARRPTNNAFRELEPRRGPAANNDILHKAQELSMKIWQVEKFQRIMITMFEIPNDFQPIGPTLSRSKAQVQLRGDREADLSRMLRDERLHGPLDRDATLGQHELIPFRGPYIYIRDMDERTRPVMVKEWPKRKDKDDKGEWPQFRAQEHGKCPFVEDKNMEERLFERIRQEEELLRHERGRSRSATRSRAPSPRKLDETDEEDDVSDQVRTEAVADNYRCSQAFKEHQRQMEATDRSSRMSGAQIRREPTPQLCPPPSRLPEQTRSPEKPVSGVFANSFRECGAEPAASGLQPSNITSAIRSQMISSTAAAPGAKAGTSKEVHGLKRKVLEKNTGPVLNSIQNRQQIYSHVAIARAEYQISHTRQTNRQNRDALRSIHEEPTQSEEGEDVWLAEVEDVRTREESVPESQSKKEPKPGYCENCRAKYDDFEEHTTTDRKHRKFALDPTNWRDLDKLLAQLVRPRRELQEDGF